jgi:hypothetical protein
VRGRESERARAPLCPCVSSCARYRVRGEARGARGEGKGRRRMGLVDVDALLLLAYAWDYVCCSGTFPYHFTSVSTPSLNAGLSTRALLRAPPGGYKPWIVACSGQLHRQHLRAPQPTHMSARINAFFPILQTHTLTLARSLSLSRSLTHARRSCASDTCVRARIKDAHVCACVHSILTIQVAYHKAVRLFHLIILM